MFRLSVKAIIVLMLLVNTIYAAPKQIIIIRHADKLNQAVPGPALSPQGLLRSILFAMYFEKNYGDPDVIVASHPTHAAEKNASIRELQTVLPLANLVASHHPQQGFSIWYPYPKHQYEKLAQVLLNDARFNQKRIVVCWDHSVIPQLANLLGVKEKLTKWPEQDFDTVFVIDYDNDGKVSHFTMLHHQYVIKDPLSWQDLYNKLK